MKCPQSKKNDISMQTFFFTQECIITQAPTRRRDFIKPQEEEEIIFN